MRVREYFLRDDKAASRLAPKGDDGHFDLKTKPTTECAPTASRLEEVTKRRLRAGELPR
jgi:hypothetical protein